MTIRWKFLDPTTLVEETIFLNPQEMRLPVWEKSINVEETTAPGSEGRVILAEGVDKVQTLGFDGVTLTLDQITFLQNLYLKRYQVRLTDDFDRVWWIYITKLTLTRTKTRPTHPEYHRYSLESYVLDWPT